MAKTKIDRIRSQQIRESCGIQPIDEWVERRREWGEHVTRMDAEILVKIPRISDKRTERLNPSLKQAESPTTTTTKKKTYIF